MKTTDGQYDPSYAAYVERMADELRKLPKRPVSTVQCASTQATLDRPVEDDLKHWLRPLPECRAVPNAATPDEAVGLRLFDATQVAVVEDIRRKGRNTFGQSEESSVTPEKKEKAIHAFIYTPPAPLTPAQIQQAKDNEMTVITMHTPTMEDVNASTHTPKTWDMARTWWDKLWGKVSMKNVRDKK